jgi:hypothetical protein
MVEAAEPREAKASAANREMHVVRLARRQFAGTTMTSAVGKGT